MSHVYKKLSVATVNLMKISPTNPTVRGLVLKQTGVNVPLEVKTFEEMIAFLEKEIKPPEPLKINVNFDIRRIRLGTATFKQVIEKTEVVTITELDIMNLAEAASDWDDFSDRILNFVRGEIEDNVDVRFEPLGATHSDGVHYLEHSVNQEVTQDSDFDCYEVLKQAKRWMQLTYPDTFERLDNPE